MKCLTVRQPWAWLLIHGGKDIENREWFTLFRGPLAIAASAGMTKAQYYGAWDFVRQFDPELARRMPYCGPLALERGAVIGIVDQVGCVAASASPWFQGKYGHVYTNPRPLVVPAPAKGHLGFWEWDERTAVAR